MKTFFIIFLSIFIVGSVEAGTSVCYQGEVITGIFFETSPEKYVGCKYFERYVDEPQFTNINSLRSTRRDFLKFKNNKVILKTQAEKNSITASEVTKITQAKAIQLSKLDDSIVKNRTMSLPKSDLQIESAGFTNAQEIFIKRLVRYIASSRE